MIKILRILLWDSEIGYLAWQNGEAYFVYNQSFLSADIEPFPLLAPKSRGHLFKFTAEEERKYQHLPAFIADSLPDDWGNTLFEQWAKEQHLSENDITALDKLAFIGRRGMGALEFMPERSPLMKNEHVDIGALANLAQKIQNQRENLTILPSESLTMQMLLAVGTSVGGRQAKAVLAINPQTGEIRSGQVAPPAGFLHYILKFGIVERSTAELEMTYYDMAQQAEIDMMPCRLWEVEGTKHFITERFDRKDSTKIHTQTLAAMDPDANSYEKLLLVCRKLRLPDSCECEVFRRMVFNYLTNNTDDHNKNFSFLMNTKGEWSLSPAYDLTFIFNNGGYQPEPRHCLMLRGKYTDWTKEDALEFAKSLNIRRPGVIIDQIAEVAARFRSLATQRGVAPEWIGRIESVINRHLAEWGYIVVPELSWTTKEGHIFGEVSLSQAYKGAIQLHANVDGNRKRFVFSKNSAETQMMVQAGIANIPKETLQEWAEKYLLK